MRKIRECPRCGAKLGERRQSVQFFVEEPYDTSRNQYWLVWKARGRTVLCDECAAELRESAGVDQ